MNNKSILISSLWRSSSTYFLNKFRANNSICYYEPFHESISYYLSNKSKNDSKLIFYTAKLKSGHYTSQSNYFEEYQKFSEKDKESLINLLTFNYINDYFNSDTMNNRDNYINALYNLSLSVDTIPIFGFVRSLGILPELLNILTKNFKLNLFSIILIRNPYDVFTSFYDQVEKWNNDYFILNTIKILLNSQCNLINHDDNNTILNLKKKYELYENDLDKTIKSFSVEELYAIFSYFYILSYSKGLMSNSNIIFIEKLALDLDYQEYISNLIENQINLKINFNDCKLIEKISYPISYKDSQKIFYQVAEEIYQSSINNEFSQSVSNLISIGFKPYSHINLNSQDNANENNKSYSLKDLSQINLNLLTLSQTTVEMFESLNKTNNILEINSQELHKTKAEYQQLTSEYDQLTKLNQQTQSQLQKTQSQLQTTQSQLQKTQSQLQKTQSQLNDKNNQLHTTQINLNETSHELIKTKQIVEAMESSKFWKLRQIWFYFKKAFGLTHEN